MGFCFFNNAAIAARYAQNTYGERLGLRRVAVVVRERAAAAVVLSCLVLSAMVHRNISRGYPNAVYWCIMT